MHFSRFLSLAGLLAAASTACYAAKTEVPQRESNAAEHRIDATYAVTLASIDRPHFTVRAELPLADDTLRMATSRPCDLDALCSAGWPLFVQHLRVADSSGRLLRTEPIGAGGWIVRDPHAGRVIVEYSVSYDLLAQNGWPAPREAAFSDGSSLFTVGRPLFIGTSAGGPAQLRFSLPPGMHVVAPWLPDSVSGAVFAVPDFDALAENAFVVSDRNSKPVAAGQFLMNVALFGRWREERDFVTHLLNSHLATFTRLLGFDDRGAYLAVFLEDSRLGGEAFLSSFVMSASPDSSVATWGRLIAHEVFHYWNGHRLRGADYVSSQWFQEGMAEYYAIVSMARNGFIAPDAALAQLSRHLRAHRDFGRSLAESGNRKNRAFYGSATMAAFALDLMIRDATDNRSSLDDLMREMWITFGETDRPFAYRDVPAMASATAGIDLHAFFRNHIEGDIALPMDEILPLAGLKLTRNAQGEETITEDPSAPAELRARWQALITRSD